MIRVLLADDQPLVRAGLRVLLDTADDIDLVGEAATGAEALTLARSSRADVILMDIRMPELDGVAATAAIAAADDLAGVKVLILTTYETDDYIFTALHAGASGFLLKDTDPADLLTGIRVVAAGDALLAPSVTRRLIADIAHRPTPGAPTRTNPNALAILTAREREVMALVAHGLSNNEIATGLVLSPLTVKTHISRTMTKLAARDRAQLVVLAYQTGLVTPDRP